MSLYDTTGTDRVNTSVARNKTATLLVNEHLHYFSPTLAALLGLDEAIFLQKLHYWLINPENKNVREGVTWAYNTYAQWQALMPYMNEVKITRVIKRLEKIKILISSDKFNRIPTDRTKWYTIDYDRYECLVVGTSDQIDLLDRSKRSARPIKMIDSNQCIQTIYTNNKKDHCAAGAARQDVCIVKNNTEDLKDVLSYLNLKVGSKFRKSTELEARLKDGTTVEECKQVIDKKLKEWINTPYRKYLRPITLFNKSKFETYLGEPDDLPPPTPDGQPTRVSLATDNFHTEHVYDILLNENPDTGKLIGHREVKNVN